MADDPRDEKDDEEKVAQEESEEGDAADKVAKQALVRADGDEPSEEGGDAAGASEEGGDGDGEEEDDDLLPTQMGQRRYVYATFFTFAIALAYFFSKAGLALWHRLNQWIPGKIGEPREDLITPIAAAVSGIAMFLVYRRQAVRTLADEVTLELSKVEWPTKEKVRRSTTIVVVASLGSALGFWLYDIGANRAIGFIADSSKTWVVLLRVGLGGLAIYLIRALGLRFLVGTGRA